MGKLLDIRDGWKNFIDKSEVSELIAEKRAYGCETANNGKLCIYATKTILSAFVKTLFTLPSDKAI